MCNSKRCIANSITCCRIVSSIVMLLFPVFSQRWYIAYLLCGLTDVIDGPVARKTGSASAFGSKLDSIADLIFAAAAFIQLLPVLRLPVWIWIWTIIIFIFKVTGITAGCIREKRFDIRHSNLNKATGLLLFLLPLTLTFIELKISAIVICSAATLSAIQEMY